MIDFCEIIVERWDNLLEQKEFTDLLYTGFEPIPF